MSTNESPLTTGVEFDGDALHRAVVAPIRALAFWTAVLLPLAYLPLLAGGLTGAETSVLAALLVANALALAVGHDHARD